MLVNFSRKKYSRRALAASSRSWQNYSFSVRLSSLWQIIFAHSEVRFGASLYELQKKIFLSARKNIILKPCWDEFQWLSILILTREGAWQNENENKKRWKNNSKWELHSRVGFRVYMRVGEEALERASMTHWDGSFVIRGESRAQTVCAYQIKSSENVVNPPLAWLFHLSSTSCRGGF